MANPEAAIALARPDGFGEGAERLHDRPVCFFLLSLVEAVVANVGAAESTDMVSLLSRGEDRALEFRPEDGGGDAMDVGDSTIGDIAAYAVTNWSLSSRSPPPPAGVVAARVCVDAGLVDIGDIWLFRDLSEE